MITLFHGSNVTINEIDLSKGVKDKDFGQGLELNRQFFFGTEKAIAKLKKI